MKIAKPIAKMVASVLCLLLAGTPLLAEAQEKVPARRWKLKYEAGSAPFTKDQAVRVFVGPEAILLHGGKNREQSINIPDVTQITYDTTRGRYVSRALANLVLESQTSDELMLATFVGLPLAIVTLPFKGTRHFVTIEWTEGRQHRAVVLRMKGDTARDFLLELAQAVGVTPRDLDRERAAFKNEQQRKNALQKQVQLSQAAPTSN